VTSADASSCGTTSQIITVGAQRLRVSVRSRASGDGPTLLLINGIGVRLESFRPFVDELTDAGIEVIGFDIPGVAGAPPPVARYRFPGLARLVRRLLDRLGHRDVDVLGVSWGGGLAQEFARRHSQRCRRLVLVSTSPGAASVPGAPSALARMISPRRFTDPGHTATILRQLYGGKVRTDPALARRAAAAISGGDGSGYYGQLYAALGWTSIHWLHTLRQPTLILSGTDDPIVPAVNARIMHRLIPDARLHLVDDGHLALLTSARTLAPIVEQFLREDRT
jgi:poly(3-hydroxyoctanoate) depolymerase